MNDIAIYRGIIDACCYIAGYLSKLNLDDDEANSLIDLLKHACHLADAYKNALIDEMFLPKKSE